MSDLDNRIRERAYFIWLEQGCPDGRDKEHWDMASELVAQEENQHFATKPNPLSTERAQAPGGEPVEPILAATNQGEFPTLTDQGEESTSPAPRNSRGRRSR